MLHYYICRDQDWYFFNNRGAKDNFFFSFVEKGREILVYVKRKNLGRWFNGLVAADLFHFENGRY